MDREYIDKWADEIFYIAQENWNNLDLLKNLQAELNYRSSSAGVRVRNEVNKRIAELKAQEQFSFKWPSTYAPGGNGQLSGDQFWYKDGLLSYVGYRVGKTHGLEEVKRQQILDYILFNELPRVVSLEYMQEWGTPRSAKRLKKMAESIASFARNAKRRNYDGLSYAIDDWGWYSAIRGIIENASGGPFSGRFVHNRRSQGQSQPI